MNTLETLIKTFERALSEAAASADRSVPTAGTPRTINWSRFANALREHGGAPSQIEAIAMDMSPACVKGATQYFPQAKIVFDKFHLMVLAGQALDEVRRELQREGAELKGALWSLRGNAWNLSEERQEQRKNLSRQYTKLGRAMSLRETLQAIYASPERHVAEAELAWWCG